MTDRRGIVYLVGAGPGDPGLLTRRGLEVLRKADVVVFDRLVSPAIVREADPAAEMIDVGKQPDKHPVPQYRINEILVEKALAGHTVCRLKGGDPFVFGRGGEEAEALLEAGCAFEIVPGITSAIGGVAYAGIPVTHRECASSFAVITGHEDPTKEETSIRWEHLAHGVDTLVFLMGIGNLPYISAKLLEQGRSADTPVALVRWASTPLQEVLIGTLGDIAEKAAEAGIKPPALTVVGDVVKLRETLRWFDKRPLFGKRILVTRSREQASEFAELLTGLGADVVEKPVIRIQPLPDYTAVDAAAGQLSSYDWVIFTSVNGVEHFMDRVYAAGLDARAFNGAKLCAIGPATAERLANYGLRADCVPPRFIAESVVEELSQYPLEGERVLIPRAREARELIPEKLAERGAAVEVLPVYETVREDGSGDELRRQLTAEEIDIVTFTASSTVSNFVEIVGADTVRQLPASVLMASIGPVTTQTARDHGITVAIEAEEHTLEGLANAICAAVGKDGEE